MKKYEPTYWNHKGKYQMEYDLLNTILVPIRGNASTKQGQLLRAIGNFYHEKYNNGFCNSVGRYTNYIRKYCRSRNLKTRVFKGISEKELDKSVDKIMAHLLKTTAEPLSESDKF